MKRAQNTCESLKGKESAKMEQMDIPGDAWNQELDIPPEAFENEAGVPPPQTKTRLNIMSYEEKPNDKIMAAQVETFRANEKFYKASTAKYKIQKAVTESGSRNVLIGLIMAMRNDINRKFDEAERNSQRNFDNLNRNFDNLHRNFDNLHRNHDNFHRNYDNLQHEVNRIKGDVDGMKPLMLYVRTSENARRRLLREPEIPVPFLVGEGPIGTDLPSVNSVEDIEAMNAEQLHRYLAGYDVQHNPQVGTKRLKRLLRDALGFSSLKDMRFEFS